MDLSEYIAENPERLAELAKRTRMQVMRLRQLCRNADQAVRYMTARRICAASDGAVTMEALARRGAMPGTDIFDGPLGALMAEIASTGPDVATRLAEAGVRREQFNSMMLGGWVPRTDNMRRISQAFDGRLLAKDFDEHAAWRRSRVK